MSERLAFWLLGKPESARGALRATSDDAPVPVLEPRQRRRRRVDDQPTPRIDGDQLEGLEPDLEGAVADDLAEAAPDLRPVVAISKAWQTETPTDVVEVDPDRPTALSAMSGDTYVSSTTIECGGLPPSGGLGGLS